MVKIGHQVQQVEGKDCVVRASARHGCISVRYGEAELPMRLGGELLARDFDHAKRDIRCQQAPGVRGQTQRSGPRAASDLQYILIRREQALHSPQGVLIARYVRDWVSRVLNCDTVPEEGLASGRLARMSEMCVIGERGVGASRHEQGAVQ